MTRWVKVDAAPRRTSGTNTHAADAARVDSYRQILDPSLRRSRTASWLRRGGLLMAAGYLASWGWQIAAQHKRTSQENSASQE